MGLAVSAFILYSGVNMAKETISPLLGESASPELAEKIAQMLSAEPRVLGFHDLMVHDYGPGKTIIFLIVTVVGALIIIFLLLVFFSLLGDAASYFISLYREIAFRLY